MLIFLWVGAFCLALRAVGHIAGVEEHCAANSSDDEDDDDLKLSQRKSMQIRFKRRINAAKAEVMKFAAKLMT